MFTIKTLLVIEKLAELGVTLLVETFIRDGKPEYCALLEYDGHDTGTCVSVSSQKAFEEAIARLPYSYKKAIV